MNLVLELLLFYKSCFFFICVGMIGSFLVNLHIDEVVT